MPLTKGKPHQKEGTLSVTQGTQEGDGRIIRENLGAAPSWAPKKMTGVALTPLMTDKPAAGQFLTLQRTSDDNHVSIPRPPPTFVSQKTELQPGNSPAAGALPNAVQGAPCSAYNSTGIGPGSYSESVALDGEDEDKVKGDIDAVVQAAMSYGVQWVGGRGILLCLYTR